MSIDLERFPWSDSANRMLTYVTKGWYDKSYVGKWIYEVMGRELDLATVHIEELPYQMFIDTATWGLKYHEIKYGLPVREDLSYEERRRLLREKKNTKAPMIPWRMEQILKGVTDYDVQVHDCNEPGHYFIKSGTSMSTPLVSGAIALLLEKYPSMSNKDVKLRIRERAVDLGLPHNQQGWGKLDVKRLLADEI